jgi:hypothetical protein
VHYPGHVVSTRRHVLFLCGALLVPVMIAMAQAAYGASFFAQNQTVKRGLKATASSLEAWAVWEGSELARMRANAC